MTDEDWPFDAWLKLAVRGFGLSPQQFWQMSLRDWLGLTRTDQRAAMSADELAALSQHFPDEVLP